MRWPEGPPHLDLNHPSLFCVPFCVIEGQKTIFPMKKGFSLFLNVSLCFFLAFCFTSLCHTLFFSSLSPLSLSLYVYIYISISISISLSIYVSLVLSFFCFCLLLFSFSFLYLFIYLFLFSLFICYFVAYFYFFVFLLFCFVCLLFSLSFGLPWLILTSILT